MLGCADPLTPDGGWIHREGDQATITCHDTEYSWVIKCNATSGTWTTTQNTCLQGMSISLIKRVYIIKYCVKLPVWEGQEEAAGQKNN